MLFVRMKTNGRCEKTLVGKYLNTSATSSQC
jgi:hypothetical protein